MQDGPRRFRPAGAASCPAVEWRTTLRIARGRALSPTPSTAPVLALDLGGSRIRAAVVGADGSRHARTERPTPNTGSGDVVAACIAALRESAAQTAEAARREVVGIGISAPGPVDPRTGVVLEPPNLGSDFRNIPLAASVAAALELPTSLDRDTNVALLGERTFGAARGQSDAVYITVSTGVGGAILSSGAILRGPDGLAGELGHLAVELDGPRCGCGGIGHVESIASGVALARDARAAAIAGTSAFLSARAASGATLTGRDVSAGAAAGDETCLALLARTRRAVAAACVSIANTLNPHLIVIGGAIGLALGDALLAEVRLALRDEVFPVIGRRVEVVSAGLGDDVSLAGAWPLVHGHAATPPNHPRSSNDRLPSASRRAAGSPKEVAIP